MGESIPIVGAFAELALIRLEMDELCEKRAGGAWTVDDYIRYQKLCTEEAALLGTEGSPE